MSAELSFCPALQVLPKLSWLWAEFKVLVVVRLKFCLPRWVSARGAALRNEDMPAVPQPRGPSRNP